MVTNKKIELTLKPGASDNGHPPFGPCPNCPKNLKPDEYNYDHPEWLCRDWQYRYFPEDVDYP